MKKKMFVIFIFVIFAIQNVVVVSGQDDMSLGSNCMVHDGTPGTCRRAKNCNWAKAGLAAKTLTVHQLVRCGFDKADLVICCKRSADWACENHKKIAREYTDFRVIGGELADEGEFPHMAALGYYDAFEKKFKYNCGGSLISKHFILTAAHCVNKRTNLPSRIKLGSVKVIDNDTATGEHEQNLEIKNITLHPAYSSKKKYNDIALIELATPPVFSKDVYPACLLTSPRDIPEKLLVTGWGIFQRKSRETSQYLLKGALSFVTIPECNELYKDQVNSQLSEGIIKGQLCAVDKRDVEVKIDACQGDSGGPLNLQTDDITYVVGLTSFGLACGSSLPGVYTRVSEYLDFIESRVWPGTTIE